MPADPKQIAAARQLLDSLGITLSDLQTTPDPPTRVPTVADFVPRVAAAAGPGARRTYGAYWNRMATAWGPRLLTDIPATDVEALRHEVASSSRSRRNGRGGRHAGEHLIAAARALFNRAIADGYLDAKDSPAPESAVPASPVTRCCATATGDP
jgi:hypothetical protein